MTIITFKFLEKDSECVGTRDSQKWVPDSYNESYLNPTTTTTTTTTRFLPCEMGITLPNLRDVQYQDEMRAEAELLAQNLASKQLHPFLGPQTLFITEATTF